MQGRHDLPRWLPQGASHCRQEAHEERVLHPRDDNAGGDRGRRSHGGYLPVSVEDFSGKVVREEEFAKIAEPYLSLTRRRRLPQDRQSITHKFQIGQFEGYFTIGLYEDGTPGEIFFKASKEGTTVSGMLDAWAVAWSLGFQYGVPVDAFVRLYMGMRFEPAGMTQNREIPVCTSVADYVARWMSIRFLKAASSSSRQPRCNVPAR